jgi:hypothetical protein
VSAVSSGLLNVVQHDSERRVECGAADSAFVEEQRFPRRLGLLVRQRSRLVGSY